VTICPLELLPEVKSGSVHPSEIAFPSGSGATSLRFRIGEGRPSPGRRLFTNAVQQSCSNDHGAAAFPYSSLPIANARRSVCIRSYLTSSSPRALDEAARSNRARTAWLQSCTAAFAISSRAAALVPCVAIIRPVSRYRQSWRSLNSSGSIRPEGDVCAAAPTQAKESAATRLMLFHICECPARGLGSLDVTAPRGLRS